MTNRPPQRAAPPPRRDLITALILFGIVGGAAFLFLSGGARRAAPVLPLDDAYIHLQYARSIAEGHAFRYNPDQPPTSGATSLLYPPILAVGYGAGLRGESLSWWALAIGVLSWLASTWYVYRIAASNGGPYAHWIGVAVAAAFALHGALGFAFLSGMETGLFTAVCLLTFWNVARNQARNALLSGALAALIRPEGVVIGVGAALYFAVRPGGGKALRQYGVLFALPIAAFAAQPLLNLALTGSPSATGLQAKAYLYNIPPDVGVMIGAVVGNIGRIWQELITGVSAVDGEYRTALVTLAALLTVGFGLLNALRTRRPNSAVLVGVWLLGLTVTVSVLETAFWQFKRYQMPMLALLFPLAAWPIATLTRRGANAGLARLAALAGIALIGADSVRALSVFSTHYAENTREVAESQFPMAQYVAVALPPTAVIGVHDIGLMRYFGGRTTYDVIGLTTPGAAAAWRHGPGAAYEFMARSAYRPDYFAIYPDARGLTYFADTGLFREQLAAFPSTAPTRNVASATNSGQNVYKADWTHAPAAAQPHQPYTLMATRGMAQIAALNVADLDSEKAYQYRWWQAVNQPGFPSEVYELDYIACGEPPCRALDGGRLINGGEEFQVTVEAEKAAIWVMRVHPRDGLNIRLFANDADLGVKVIPAVPGQWLEIATLIPADQVTGSALRLRVQVERPPDSAGFYMPYYHWVYQGAYTPDDQPTFPAEAVPFGEGIALVGRQVSYEPVARRLTVDLEWRQTAPIGPDSRELDAVTFVHLYDAAGTLIESAQVDRRPGGGALPPANWIPGLLVRDQIVIRIPDSVPAGKYTVKIGLYGPNPPYPRLRPAGPGADAEDRLFIGEIEVQD